MGPERKGAEGNELDQFWSAKFLEDVDTAMTSIARKEAFKKIDQVKKNIYSNSPFLKNYLCFIVLKDHNGKMSTIEYLIWKYNKSLQETVDAPQGTSPELERAQQSLARLQVRFSQRFFIYFILSFQETLKELQAAVDELKKQEDAYNNKINELNAKANDPNATTVNRNKAANELAQVKVRKI